MQTVYEIHSFVGIGMRGNPAGVCVLEQPRGPAWMQQVAARMGLSETAFVVPEKTGYRLRWFTPITEVELCGHATLAAAYVLWQLELHAGDQSMVFHTASGDLTAHPEDTWIEISLPAIPVMACVTPTEIINAVGVKPVATARAGEKYLLELADEVQVRTAKPNFAALRDLQVRGVMITSAAQNSQYDFVSRYFAPAVGINEDPVTGSAHCSLVPWWAKRLNKIQFLAQQVSARGGELRLRLQGDRVAMAGRAVISGQREFYD